MKLGNGMAVGLIGRISLPIPEDFLAMSRAPYIELPVCTELECNVYHPKGVG